MRVAGTPRETRVCEKRVYTKLAAEPHTSAYVSIRQEPRERSVCVRSVCIQSSRHVSTLLAAEPHTSAYVSIRQHTSYRARGTCSAPAASRVNTCLELCMTYADVC